MTAHGSSGAEATSPLRLGHPRQSGETDRSIMLTIPKAIVERMIEHARREAPHECCGMLAGREKRVMRSFELENAERSPLRYSIHPLQQLKVFEEIEQESMELLAIYHSHPETIAFPSETDVKMAFYPEVASIIISLKDDTPNVKAFWINPDAIYPEEIGIIE